jgi:hypothetical protein
MEYSRRKLKRLDKLNGKDLMNYQEVIVVVGRSLFYVFNREEIKFPWAIEITRGKIEIINCRVGQRLKLKIKNK